MRTAPDRGFWLLRTRRWCVPTSLFVASLLLTAPASAQPPGVDVLGVVRDQTAASLPTATVELLQGSQVVQTVQTDSTGGFRFTAVRPGAYQIRASFTGFDTATQKLTVGIRPPSALHITLPLAGVAQRVTVTSAATRVETGAANNLDTVAVDQSTLQNLPVLDNDYVSTLTQLLDAGSLGTNGATIVVNGMEVNSLDVTASAIQQIKINQDPYSSEYSRPGRGRIEILTKPGTQQWHGDANVTFRDSALNARNAFTTERPPEQRRIFEGFLGGPVGTGGKTSFMLSADQDAEDLQAIVFADGVTGPIRATAATPRHHLQLAGSITHQRSAATTWSVRTSYEDSTRQNSGVGGISLPSTGIDSGHREEQVVYTQQTIFGPSLVNQFRLLAGQEREPTTSVSADPRLVVQGAFIGGGGQSELLRTEHHLQWAESLTWTKGRNLLQVGFQAPDWSRRRFDDSSDAGGTFYFSSLSDYRMGQPYAFIQQSGNGHVAFLEKMLGAYMQDDWQPRDNVSTSFGLRYDWQNYFHDNNNLSPRGSVSWALGSSHETILRGGAGVFYDRTGPTPIADLLHYRDGGLVRIVVTNPSYPNPFQSGGSVTSQPPSVVRLAPDVQIPFTLQYSLGLERQLAKNTTVAVTYIGSQGYHRFLSRDVNAPPPPLYLVRPDPAYGVIRQIESTGRQRGNSLELMLRGNLTRWFTGQMRYTLSRTMNNTDGISWFPANDYDLSGEWGPASFDRRHRFFLLGQIKAGRLVNVGVALTVNSGAPYSETLGQDLFNNGRGTARPAGVARNTLRAAAYADLDLKLSRDFALAGGAHGTRVITIGLDAFNVLNRVNLVDYVGNVGSPFFEHAVAAGPPRQLQLSLRYKF